MTFKRRKLIFVTILSLAALISGIWLLSQYVLPHLPAVDLRTSTATNVNDRDSIFTAIALIALGTLIASFALSAATYRNGDYIENESRMKGMLLTYPLGVVAIITYTLWMGAIGEPLDKALFVLIVIGYSLCSYMGRLAHKIFEMIVQLAR